jgi:hypothetical protein
VLLLGKQAQGPGVWRLHEEGQGAILQGQEIILAPAPHLTHPPMMLCYLYRPADIKEYDHSMWGASLQRPRPRAASKQVNS